MAKFDFTILMLVISPVFGGNSPPLESYNVDTSRITVSGLSAGGCFATQFHVAYSSVISGMGSWAGVANTCFATYSYNCMYFADNERVDRLVDNTNEIAGRIDDVTNLAGDRVYIMHGTEDKTVDPDAANIMSQYYAEYLTDHGTQLAMNIEIPSTHAIQSDHTGTECGTTNRELYIENCDYDSPYNVLNHIIDGGAVVGVTPDTWEGELLMFDQDEFFENGQADKASMDDTGYVYIPPKCFDSANLCLLHIHFHGCTMQAENVGTDFILASGFLELADSNNMIVIFPQNKADVLMGNPNGCFDWFKYTNPSLLGDPLFYATKEAPQMDAIYRMLLRAASME